ncbi:MAG: preprotein translocase subunit SecE [Clostridia bacterium]|nr:preprotein translocase subunit SecE [Clostridia bacterium]
MAEKKTAVEAKVEKNDKKPAAKKPGVFKRIFNFFKGMRSELKKVTWPSFRQVVNNTLVVLVVVIGSGVFIGLVDLLFTKVFAFLIGA